MNVFQDRSFIKEIDYTPEELAYLVDFSAHLKKLKQKRIPHRYLEGQTVALIFEKASTRTRAAFTIAARDLGAHPEYLGQGEIQLGKKESIEDTAKVLGRMFDGIEYRGFAHSDVETLAEHAGVPVWNGLSDRWHPTQSLADYLTIKENFNRIAGVNVVYLGDGRNNVANSLLIAGAMLGANVTVCSPEELMPASEVQNIVADYAANSGSVIDYLTDPQKAVKGADVLYTDVWVSMGEEEKFEERLNILGPYQVTEELIEATGNSEVIFLHCLPAYHDLETQNGKNVYEAYGLEAMEVSDSVFRSTYARQFDQAENRLHTIKAIMATSLGSLFIPSV